MLRIAVVEDDVQCSQKLIRYLRQYEAERRLRLEISVFTDGDGIADNYKMGFDMILMDVEMPFLNGMDAAKLIRDVDPEVTIIFITNMPQYAIQGYAVNALDYILKPINYFAFSQRLDQAIRKLKKREVHYLTIFFKGSLKKLEVSCICYVESQGRNLLFHTLDEVLTSVGTMKDMEARLAPFHFVRGNKGYLINLEYVDGIQDGCALVNGESLLLSRARKASFLEAMANYVGGFTI